MRFRLVLSGIFSGLLLVGLMCNPLSAQTITGQDDFGTGFDGSGNPTLGNQMFTTRTLTPNNQGNPSGFTGAPGVFANPVMSSGDNFDVFGITNRNILFDVADDSDPAGPDFFEPDDFGFAGYAGGPNDCGNFIAMADLQNPNNNSGLVTATWTFDVSGGNYTIHRISMDVVAYGDFEGPPPPKSSDIQDQVLFTGGVTTDSPLFDFSMTDVQDAADTPYQVFMESGVIEETYFDNFFSFDNWNCLFSLGTLPGVCPATGDTVDWHPADDGGAGDDGTAMNGLILDPTFSDPNNTAEAYEETNTNGTFNEVDNPAYRDPIYEQADNTQLTNTKQTFVRVIKESGNTFTLNMVAAQNGSREIIAIDNILLESAVLGDANDDGTFDNIDIASFVLALTDSKAYAAMFPNVDVDFVLDMDCSGEFNNQDIAAFVAALTGG